MVRIIILLRPTSLAHEILPTSVKFFIKASITVVLSSSQARVLQTPSTVATKTWSIRGTCKVNRMDLTLVPIMLVSIWVATWFLLASSQIRHIMLAWHQSVVHWVPTSSKKAPKVVSIWTRTSLVIAKETLVRNLTISTTKSFSFHLCKSPAARKVSSIQEARIQERIASIMRNKKELTHYQMLDTYTKVCLWAQTSQCNLSRVPKIWTTPSTKGRV